MSEDVMAETTQIELDGPGWQVLDPDGNVVASGPGIVLEMVAHTGEEE